MTATNSRIYAVNLRTGEEIWSRDDKVSDIRDTFARVVGIGDKFVFYDSGDLLADDPRQDYYVGDVETGEIERFYTNNKTGDLSLISPFVGKDGDTLFSFVYSEYQVFNNINTEVEGYMGLYNLSKKELVYDKKVYDGPYVKGFPTFFSGDIRIGDNICLAGDENIMYRNLFTGELVWNYQTGDDQTAIPYYFGGDKIFVTQSTAVYAIDVATGTLVWTTPHGGTSSHISYLNEVIYFTTSGDGDLHAIDANTGEHIWRLQGYDERFSIYYSFLNNITAVENKDGEGRVLVQSFLSAYAFEAVR